MSSNTNIAELARYCNVSQATVSRVFSGTAPVKEETRRLVLEAARELNYSPQQTARRDYIAIVVPRNQDIEPPSWFAAMLATALMREIYRAGYIARLYEAGDIQLIQPNFTVAAIMLNWRPGDREYERMVGLQRPVISINYEGVPYAHSVSTDHRQGIAMAVRHLYEHGHRRIAHLICRSDNWGNRERETGYREILNELGIEFDPRLVCSGNPDGSLPEAGLKAVLESGATALVCAHEDWTMEIHHYLNRLEYRVPDDVSVVAAEIPGLSRWLNPPYSSIGQNAKALADAAIEVIEALPRQSEIPVALMQRRLPYSFTARDSVKSI